MQYYLLMPVLFLMLPAKWRTPVLVALFAGLTGYATYRGTQPDAVGSITRWPRASRSS
jgi:peptidoglycan/LPS O-acetylase OafA/YrhL